MILSVSFDAQRRNNRLLATNSVCFPLAPPIRLTDDNMAGLQCTIVVLLLWSKRLPIRGDPR